MAYVGSLISLISKAGIRYEGILEELNETESTVSLKDVRCFGTEGRNPSKEIPASDQRWDSIRFRGSDIQDLKVLQVTAKAASPAPNIEDPAILSSSTAKPARSPSPPGRVEPSSTPEPVRETHSNGYRGNYRGRRGGFRGGHRPPAKPFTIPTTEFDMEKSNALFDKEQTRRAIETQNETVDDSDALSEAFYDKKSSFFDNISCESKEKAANNSSDAPVARGQGRMAQEKKLNYETFGQAQPHGNRHYRGGYRGRGNYRGRGRGRNYHNNKNNVTFSD